MLCKELSKPFHFPGTEPAHLETGLSPSQGAERRRLRGGMTPSRSHSRPLRLVALLPRSEDGCRGCSQELVLEATDSHQGTLAGVIRCREGKDHTSPARTLLPAHHQTTTLGPKASRPFLCTLLPLRSSPLRLRQCSFLPLRLRSSPSPFQDSKPYKAVVRARCNTWPQGVRILLLGTWKHGPFAWMPPQLGTNRLLSIHFTKLFPLALCQAESLPSSRV